MSAEVMEQETTDSQSARVANGQWSRRMLAAAAGVVVLAFFLATMAVPHTGFNPDESRWISRAHYLAALTDPFGPVWADQYMTRGQPPLGSYLTGLGLIAQGRDLKTNPPWDFAIAWEANIAVGNKPAPDDLAAGRRTSAVLVAIATMAVMAAAAAFVPPAWAVAAGALFAVHPFTSYIGSIAMADALFGLLIALAAVAAKALAQRPSWSRAVLLGVLLGLGGATKLSPLVLAVGFSAAGALWIAAIAIRRQHGAQRDALFAAKLLVIGATAVVAFVAVYPYLWPDPIERTHNLFTFRTEEMAAQASDWPVMAVPTRAEALRRVGVNFGERYSIAGALADRLGVTTPPSLRHLEVALPVLGIVVMTAIAVRAGRTSPQAFVLAVLGGQSAITILAMRSEFDRYHLPMALLGAVAAAVALHGAAVALMRARYRAPEQDVADAASQSSPTRKAWRNGASIPTRNTG